MIRTETELFAVGTRADAAESSCPEGLSSRQMENVRSCFEEFLKGLEGRIDAQLSAAAATRFEGMDLLPVSAALARLPAGSCISSLDLSPLPGTAYIGFGPSFIGIAVEILLGASRDAAGAQREFLTEVDLRVAGGLIDAAVEQMRAAWPPAANARTASVELAAGAASVRDSEFDAVVLTAEIALLERTDRVVWILPSLLARDASLAAPFDGMRERQRGALVEALAHCEVEAEAVLSGGSIRLRDLRHLQTGQTIEIPVEAGSPLECRINGVPKFCGRVVNAGAMGLEVQCRVTAPSDAGAAARER